MYKPTQWPSEQERWERRAHNNGVFQDKYDLIVSSNHNSNYGTTKLYGPILKLLSILYHINSNCLPQALNFMAPCIIYRNVIFPSRLEIPLRSGTMFYSILDLLQCSVREYRGHIYLLYKYVATLAIYRKNWGMTNLESVMRLWKGLL